MKTGGVVPSLGEDVKPREAPHKMIFEEETAMKTGAALDEELLGTTSKTANAATPSSHSR